MGTRPPFTMCTNLFCPNTGRCQRSLNGTITNMEPLKHFNYEIGIDGIECDGFIEKYTYTATTSTCP